MKVEINIPTSLDDIKVKQYQDFVKIEEGNDVDLIATLLKIPRDTVNKMSLKTVEEIVSDIGKLFQEQQDFIPTFKIGSTEYGFIPNLDEITFGENTDIVEYIKDWQTMHKCMAVMFRPITVKRKGQYIIEEYEGSDKYSEIMKQAPLSVAMGAMVFFYHLTNDLLSSTLKYLEEEANNQQTLGQLSETNGELITNSLNSLKEILGDLQKYPG